MKVTTMRGHQIDMGVLSAQNEGMVAIGNARMNARGDILGARGQVLRTKEEVAHDYHQSHPQAVKNVSLKDLGDEVFVSPGDAVAAIEKQNAEILKARDAAKTETKAEPTKRKIEDTDD